jgi:RNA polymerase sigma-70 factor, ECF subfamily
MQPLAEHLDASSHPLATDRLTLLVARAAAHDRAAKAELYQVHFQAVKRLAERMLRGSHDADDVAQDAFIAAFARLQQLREPALFRGWLLRIAAREVQRRLRRNKLSNEIELARGRSNPLDPGSPAAELRVELAALDRALRRLPACVQTAWRLRHLEGRKLDEVARACDVSLATVKRRLARAATEVAAHVPLAAAGC